MVQILKPSMLRAMIIFPVWVNSRIPMIERMDVSLRVIMNWLMKLGIIILIPCGKITRRIAFPKGNPRLRAASI